MHLKLLWISIRLMLHSNLLVVLSRLIVRLYDNRRNMDSALARLLFRRRSLHLSHYLALERQWQSTRQALKDRQK